MEIKTIFFVMISTGFIFLFSCDMFITKNQANILEGCVNCSADAKFDPVTITDPPILIQEEISDGREIAYVSEETTNEVNEIFEISDDDEAIRCTVPKDILNKKILICHFNKRRQGRKNLVNIRYLCPLLVENEDCIIVASNIDELHAKKYGDCSIDDCAVSSANKFY